jgi:hypothetical protein
VEAELESLAGSDDEADDELDTAATAELVEAEGRLTLFEAEGAVVATDAEFDERDPSDGGGAAADDDGTNDGRTARGWRGVRGCFACGRARPKLIACATCAAAVYCGRACRSAHRHSATRW